MKKQRVITITSFAGSSKFKGNENVKEEEYVDLNKYLEQGYLITKTISHPIKSTAYYAFTFILEEGDPDINIKVDLKDK